MAEEAKKTLNDWLTEMANQNNQCLENLVQKNIRKPQEDVDNSTNLNISKTTVDNIEYYHIEKLYEDNIYQDMKSGKCQQIHYFYKFTTRSNIFSSVICLFL